ncbi:MAG: hypothetical protein HQL27_00750 [Candidatus Omnitrophica bacterium]|nr:hypothetical protein [Candidatus Omnitrophota bacterium]
MKILVIYASAGAGHQKAAEAIYEGIKKYTSHEARLVDVLDYTNSKNLYKKSYFLMISKAPWLWAFFFGLIDIPWLQPLVRFVRRVYNSIIAVKLEKFLKAEQFDYILSTHFMPNEVASSLKAKGLIKSKVISCVTDFDVHKIWLGKAVDKYTVACEWTKEKLKSIGIDEKKIFVTGIPTNEKFAAKVDVSELKKKLGVRPDAFTALIATGSFGIGPIEEIIKALNGEMQVVVVCGHNKGLYQTLSEQKYGDVVVFSLVDNMYELMSVADVMVTKPGGLSISEALVKQLPMIFFSPIPGQETNNIMVLKRYGIGFEGSGIEEIVSELKSLMNSRDKFLTALKMTTNLSYPSAVKDIVSLIV